MKNKYAILTGAGFTHNFGAPLSDEMWSIIYNRKELNEHQDIQMIMKDLAPEYNYEKLFYAICQDKKPNLEVHKQEAFKSAVYGAYDDIDAILYRYGNQYHGNINFSDFGEFIQNIIGSDGGYFFTLNQDIFIERCLLSLTNNGDLQLYIPGICEEVEVNYDHQNEPYNVNVSFKKLHKDIPEQQININWELNKIKYVKLHGSCNWYREGSSERLMILGGNKTETMKEHWLITAYFEKFKKIITEEINKLIIVGYGFMDDHINEILIEACKRPEFKIYIINAESPKKMAERLRPVNAQKPRDSEESRRWNLFVKIRYHYPVTLSELFARSDSSGQPPSAHLARLSSDLELKIQTEGDCKVDHPT